MRLCEENQTYLSLDYGFDTISVKNGNELKGIIGNYQT